MAYQTNEHEVSQTTNSQFSEAELQLLKYQLEEKEFAQLLRVVTQLPPEIWGEATQKLSERLAH
ncbi:hypothetical protein [Polycladidibacter stylochi]|uniref:hypothetical protein n=1 Tax=Polycladidibacter stylochi TaxID=1807766 RepID=UPI000A615F6F|nr:hypothetical protein [Pseudovibrio stylochi]